MKNITVNCDGIKISNKDKICLIAGPCQLENEQHALDMAGKISEISKKYQKQFNTFSGFFKQLSELFKQISEIFKTYQKFSNTFLK